MLLVRVYCPIWCVLWDILSIRRRATLHTILHKPSGGKGAAIRTGLDQAHGQFTNVWGTEGVKYIAELFGCSERTIERAANELDELPNDPAAGRVRCPGADRKKRLNRALRWSKI